MTSLDKTIVGAVFILGLVVGAAAQDVYRQKERDAWINSEWGKYYKLRGAQLDIDQEACNVKNKSNTWNHTACISKAFLSWGNDISSYGKTLNEVANKIK